MLHISLKKSEIWFLECVGVGYFEASFTPDYRL